LIRRSVRFLIIAGAVREEERSIAAMVKVRMFFGVLNALVLVALVGACGGNTPPTTPPPAAASGNPTVALASPTMAMPTATVAPTTSAASVAPATSAAAVSAASPTQAAPAGTSVPAGASATSGTASAVEVKIVDFAFDPLTLTVPVGTKVTWTNTGVQHTVLSLDGLFSSKVLDRGDTFSFTFDKAGTFRYTCGLHPDMKAMIVVR
jgi:plastocyanin